MSQEINCIIVDDEPMAREIIEGYLQKIPFLHLIQSCKNVQEAIEVTSKRKVDLIFLDIHMPEISGMSFARIIDKKVKVIFTTAYREYAVEGFDIQALDYLLKPISFERFQQAVNKYKNLSSRSPIQDKTNEIKQEPSTFLFVRADRKMVKINFDEIVFIESLSDYIKIHLTESTLVTRETISSMEVKLPQREFMRIHRSFIIALNKITSYTNEFIEIGQQELPLSRSYKEAVLNRLSDI
jgi:DNA-binding LytR/AlgR family response regulator